MPSPHVERARSNLAGYYAHGAALDECFGLLLAALDDAGVAEDTIVVFTSDHGDTLGSHGSPSPKQQPWDESIRAPLLIRVPAKRGGRTGRSAFPIGIVDLMSTCLGLCGLPIPSCVEGADRSGLIRGDAPQTPGASLIASYVPFHECSAEVGGREWRGIRTERYTYVRDLKGPWPLYDNDRDPGQLVNLLNGGDAASIRSQLDALLSRILDHQRDRFEAGDDYLARWDYIRDPVDNRLPNHF